MPDGKMVIKLQIVQPYNALYRHQKVERERSVEIPVMIDEEHWEMFKQGAKGVVEKKEDHIRLYGNAKIVGVEKL